MYVYMTLDHKDTTVQRTNKCWHNAFKNIFRWQKELKLLSQLPAISLSHTMIKNE